jgi:hypothetical protein
MNSHARRAATSPVLDIQALPDGGALLEEIRKSLIAASLTLRCVEMGDADPRLVKLVADACDETLMHIGLLAARSPAALDRASGGTRFRASPNPSFFPER